MNKNVERLILLATVVLCASIVWSQFNTRASAQTSIPGPGSQTVNVVVANGPNASCASYKSTTTTVSKTGASIDLGATGTTKYTAWKNNSRTFRVTITDPSGNTDTLWPNDSVQFSVDAAATPDNTTATCPDCGAATTYLTGIGCDD